MGGPNINTNTYQNPYYWDLERGTVNFSKPSDVVDEA